jgi:hypothetical protein
MAYIVEARPTERGRRGFSMVCVPVVPWRRRSRSGCLPVVRSAIQSTNAAVATPRYGELSIVLRDGCLRGLSRDGCRDGNYVPTLRTPIAIGAI